MWMDFEYQGSNMEVFVWIPTPSVSRIVIADLRKARQKRTQSAHVLGVLRLLWSEWRRHKYKSMDLIIEINSGCGEIWLAIYFPYLNRCPWERCKTKLLVGL